MGSVLRFKGEMDSFGPLFIGCRCSGHAGIVMLDTQKYVSDLSVSVIV